MREVMWFARWVRRVGVMVRQLLLLLLLLTLDGGWVCAVGVGMDRSEANNTVDVQVGVQSKPGDILVFVLVSARPGDHQS